jgi:hypothetical protein
VGPEAMPFPADVMPQSTRAPDSSTTFAHLKNMAPS